MIWRENCSYQLISTSTCKRFKFGFVDGITHESVYHHNTTAVYPYTGTIQRVVYTQPKIFLTLLRKRYT